MGRKMNMVDRMRSRLGRGLVRLPPSLSTPLTAKRRVIQGKALHRQMQIVAQMTASNPGPQTWETTPTKARRQYEMFHELVEDRPPPMAKVEDRTLPGPAGPIPIRIYWASESAEPQPVLVFYHGGGWVIGSIQSHDGLCRRLAHEARCIVVSVDYRLAPEHPFPAATDDSVAAFRWVAGNAASFGGDPQRVALGGDSAGGTLSAVVAQQTREDDIKPCYQMLLYPGVDVHEKAASHRVYGDGLLLDAKLIDWFREMYVPNRADRLDPRVSPLRAEDLSGLPPAHVITADFDPLKDEGKAYADALREAGVQIQYTNYEGFLHGFANMSAFRTVRRAIAEVSKALREGFASV